MYQNRKGEKGLTFPRRQASDMDNNHQTVEKEENETPVWWNIIIVVAGAVILFSPVFYLKRTEYGVVLEQRTPLSFVGSKKCSSCHENVFKKWQGSHHDLAMDIANELTVLGDFDNVVYADPHNNVVSRFFRRDKGFFVETEGPDGESGTFEITHTFGVYPLQQYLVPFPDGRLQCLNIAWDVKQSRWYRLPPYEIKGAEDWLHWTKGGQTWNGMCAECHSTRLEKRFDIVSNSYDTRWYEIDVGCEACHGPASRHVNWAGKPAMARPQVENYELAVNSSVVDNKRQIAICAPCHARRYQLGDNYHGEGDLLDKIVPSVLDEGLYYPDGQIFEEVYVYGSFTQSKMYQHNVRCSDCHDMHSLSLHSEGNGLCLQCHRKDAYDSATHHFHKRLHNGKPSDGYLCVKCHMPGRTYMGADYRPDHSIRIPRPDLSVKIGTPNSCSASGCHGDKSLEWVNEYYTKWYGTARKAHYGEVITAGRERKAEAAVDLVQLAENTLIPSIVRATALTLLAQYPQEDTTSVYTRAIEDDDALIRHTAIRNLYHLEQSVRIKLIEPKLYDRVKAVRIEAASVLAAVPVESLKSENRQTFEKVLEEYRQAMLYNSDFAPQRYNLGNLAAARGDTDSAAEYYRQSIAIDDQFYQAQVNLAMQLNSRGEKLQAVELLKEVVGQHPDLYEVSYSLGLLLAEIEDYDGAVFYLGRAADGMPHYSRVRYNQALAFLKQQKWQQGEDALLQALDTAPDNTEYFVTLINLYLNFRMVDRAKGLAEKMLKNNPGHEHAREVLDNLK